MTRGINEKAYGNRIKFLDLEKVGKILVFTSILIDAEENAGQIALAIHERNQRAAK